jgi:hypothetical protein
MDDHYVNTPTSGNDNSSASEKETQERIYNPERYQSESKDQPHADELVHKINPKILIGEKGLKKYKKSRNRGDALKKHVVSLSRSVPMDLLCTKGQADGFYVGRVSFLGIEYDVVKPHDLDGHILIMGGSGSGKSACIAMQNLSSWPDPIICIDIKCFWARVLS